MTAKSSRFMEGPVDDNENVNGNRKKNQEEVLSFVQQLPPEPESEPPYNPNIQDYPQQQANQQVIISNGNISSEQNDNHQFQQAETKPGSPLQEWTQIWGRSPSDMKAIEHLQQEVDLYKEQQDRLLQEKYTLQQENESLQKQIVNIYSLFQSERDRALELEDQFANLLMEQYQVLELWEQQVQVMDQDAVEQQAMIDQQALQIQALQKALRQEQNKNNYKYEVSLTKINSTVRASNNENKKKNGKALPYFFLEPKTTTSDSDDTTARTTNVAQ